MEPNKTFVSDSDLFSSYPEIPTINSEKTLEFAVRSWNDGPNLPSKKPGKINIHINRCNYLNLFIFK